MEPGIIFGHESMSFGCLGKLLRRSRMSAGPGPSTSYFVELAPQLEPRCMAFAPRTSPAAFSRVQNCTWSTPTRRGREPRLGESQPDLWRAICLSFASHGLFQTLQGPLKFLELLF